MNEILDTLRESRRSHDIIKIASQGQEIPYNHEYLNQAVNKERLTRMDSERHNVPNSHYSVLDINGVWYLYNPDGNVVDTLDRDRFDAGDIAYILQKLDGNLVDTIEDSSIQESILSSLKRINESYIWSVLMSDEEIHEFVGPSTDDIKSQVVKYCKDNDLEVVNLLNVKHVRNNRELDQEYLSDIEESLLDYEISWIERTKHGNTVMRTKGFRSYDSLESFKSSLVKNPKFVELVGYLDPSGNAYLEERSDKSNYLIDKSSSGRYELYRDIKTGNLKVLDTVTNKYVNTDISVPEDFESWKDD